MFDKLGGARELSKNEMLGFGARYHTLLHADLIAAF
jgi:hypothetical protein